MKRIANTALIPGLFILIGNTVLAANTTEKEIADLKRRIEALEKQTSDQSAMPFQWSGLLELEALYQNDYSHNSTSDITVATAFLAARKNLQPDLLAGISFLYEENETSLEVDEAYLSYGNSDSLLFTAGQIYIPFGHYRSSVISDPLTLELGEIRQSAALLTYVQNNLTFNGYVFRGDSTANTDAIETIGGRVTNTFDYRGGSGFASFDFISNLLDSDALSAVNIDFADKSEAVAAAVHWKTAVWGANAEYLTALFDIDSKTPGIVTDKKPAALQLECFYNDTVKDFKVTFAASYQQTKDALLIGLPEHRWVVSAAVPLESSLTVSAQLFADEDYGQSHDVAGRSGSGDTAKGVLVQLAAKI